MLMALFLSSDSSFFLVDVFLSITNSHALTTSLVGNLKTCVTSFDMRSAFE